jgi:hypothetical protein
MGNARRIPVLVLTVCSAVAIARPQKVESFRLDLTPEQIRTGEAANARSVAAQAYLYQLPAFLHMRQAAEFIQGREHLSPGETPLGGWVLVRELSTPQTTNTMPNVDTLYGASYVWLDKQGPVVLTLPAVKGRYYSAVLHDAWYTSFGVLSPRTVVDGGGSYLIAPPGWKGDKPHGVKEVIIAPTSLVAVFQRVYLGQADEIADVRKIQDQITLTPLDAWGKKDIRFPKVDDAALRVPKLREVSDPAEYFTRTNAYTALTPPPPADARLLDLFATAGLGPGRSVPEEKHLRDAIASGAADAQAAINARLSAGPYKRGWRVPDPLTALPTQSVLGRAAVQVSQIGSLPNEEAMYFVCARDASDTLFDGRNAYTLTFEKGQLPPIGHGAFWSLTMYDDRSLLVDNPLNRYLIRPDTPGLAFGKDGSLTIHLQADEPKGVPKGNWLPAPKGGFIVVLRAYWPKKEMLDGTWFPPAVAKVGGKAEPPKGKPESESKADPLQPLAHAAAVQAFVYAHAPDGMYRRLSAEVLDPKTRKAGFDAFRHFSELSTPEKAPFRAPNNDTLYSTAWLDCRAEPVILSAPDTVGRYWTAQVMDFDSNTLTNFGARLDGTKAGTFAVVGPGWKGELPKGVTRAVKSPTGFVLVLLRVLVDGPNDAPAAAKLQQQFTLAALSRHRDGKTGPASDSEDRVPLYAAATPAERLAVLDRLLKLDPVRPGEEALMSQFAGIGIGPSKVLLAAKPKDDTLARAEADAMRAIEAAGPNIGRVVNGWLVMSKGIGSYGSDYLQRASVWMGGPLANLPEESLYPSAIVDADGKPLDGRTDRYTITFPAGQLPPVEFFWSVTMYDRKTGMLVKNPIGRYSLGNRTRGVEYGKDGSLTLYVQKDSPGGVRDANWLPAPDGEFYLSMRLYGPKPAALSGGWKPPPLTPVK